MCLGINSIEGKSKEMSRPYPSKPSEITRGPPKSLFGETLERPGLTQATSFPAGWFCRPVYISEQLVELAETARTEAEYLAGKERILNGT